MVGWHHRLNGHEFEQTPGDSEGQESLGLTWAAARVSMDCWEGNMETTMPGREGLSEEFLKQVIPELSLQRVGKEWSYISDVVLSLRVC